MQLQPRFGAVLLNKLAFAPHHAKSRFTDVVFQVTGTDKIKYQKLINLKEPPRKPDEIRILVGDKRHIDSAGFIVNMRRFDFNGNNEQRISVELYKLVRSLIQNASLGQAVQKELIQDLEDSTKRTGDNGREVSVTV